MSAISVSGCDNFHNNDDKNNAQDATYEMPMAIE